ncbi:Tubulin-specific chaperone C [Ophiocordyceps camponoti-floridani]|uniref:Tubulin-specific chaperone C n=1 Tax=Ophiocordyceps camponoti-floridani TaxID=2030778 RepID=A0A8H4Q5A8_9HYPO|nr:Tubulin-specific chaperone C [Ophiocordyceps camponoti-floridani]
MDPKQRFHRHFHESVAVVEDQIVQLESVSAVAGERQEAIDHVLAGIAQIQNSVSDAADYTPSYDRRQYAQTVKSLHDKLNETITRVRPKSRFQFRRSIDDGVHVDMGAPENDPRLNPGSLSRKTGRTTGSAVDEGDDTIGELPMGTTAAAGRDYNLELSQPGASGIRKPSFSTASNIGISNQKGLHIILPSSASRATASGSLINLRGCIVDMSVPTLQGKPFPGLSLKGISNSLIVTGRVSGPVHITDVVDSILVVIARQVRIHDCSNVDVYLHCGSHPIIEDCTGMRFAPLPESYMTGEESTTENQWDRVDDFKWLKAGHSPNWTTLSDDQTLGDEVWTKVVPGLPGASVEETLRRVGLPRE